MSSPDGESLGSTTGALSETVVTGDGNAQPDAVTPIVTPGQAAGEANRSTSATAQNTTLANMVVDGNFPWALVGRFDLSDANRPRFALAGTKIGVRFTGTSLAIQVVDWGYDAFDVTIDGVEYAAPANQFAIPNPQPVACLPTADVPAFNGIQYPGCLLLNPSPTPQSPLTFPIASNLPPGEHTAWLVKRTEFLQGLASKVQLFGFVLDANATLLPPPPVYRRRIEVMGDSSSVGYGAAQNTPCAYSERNADGGRSIASYLGTYLHAEHVNISSSGQGVYLSMYDQTGDHNLPVIYRERLPQEVTPYDFTTDHVDAVVLSAGGDDLWGDGGSGVFNNNNPSVTTPARQMFVNAYSNWLAEIRTKRPDATIFCTMTYAAFGNDRITLGSAIQDAVAVRTAAGDANVLYFDYWPAGNADINPNNYVNLYDAATKLNLPYGCRGHPQPRMAQYLAGVLGRTVAKRMGWTDVGP